MADAVLDFVKQVGERAGKTAAEAALLALGSENASHLNALTVNWYPVLGFGLGGAILSVLFSLASVPVGQPGSPSLVKQQDASVAPASVPAEPLTDPVAAAAAIFPPSA